MLNGTCQASIEHMTDRLRMILFLCCTQINIKHKRMTKHRMYSVEMSMYECFIIKYVFFYLICKTLFIVLLFFFFKDGCSSVNLLCNGAVLTVC